MNHLTKREKEILDYLKQEPMISQDELAGQMNISRSATAVHISNLMRKGYILGRGYIFDERSGVLVIGLAWREIRAQADGKGVGNIELDYAGFGYQMAVELRRYRTEATLVTAIGRDQAGDDILRQLQQKQVKVQHIARDSAIATGQRLVLIQGSQVTRMEDSGAGQLTQEYLAAKDDLLRSTRLLLVDACLPLSELQYLAAKIKVHHILSSIYGQPLVWYEQQGLLSLPSLFLVCDQCELQLPDRIPGDEPELLFPICNKIVGSGLYALVVTCGEQGVILATRDETVLLPNSPLQTALSTLSLTAGIASGLASGLGFRLALRRAMGFKSTSGN
jgi:pseudouridine kinase